MLAKHFVIPLALLSVTNNLTYAASLEPQPWSPRLTSQGLVGKEQLAGFIDTMLPLAGNANHLWFFDTSVLGGQYQNVGASAGLGLRKLQTFGTQETIVGGYFFTDYQQSTHQTHAWIANPGLELLGRQHELRVQGYIPMGSEQKNYLLTMASAVPDNVWQDAGKQAKQKSFGQGHSFFDTPVVLADEYGTGVEAELGQYFSLMHGGWIRAGVYHFNYTHGEDITGVEGNVQLYANKNLSIILQDNYDKQNKNKISLGIRLSFGGPDETNVKNLANRMETPIIRHLARQSYGMATPIRQTIEANGPTQLVADKVWFFSRTGTTQGPVITLSNCTAEHPCLDLNQNISTGIDAVQTGASLWFATGQYTLPSTGSDGFVSLANGQSLYGRTFDFRQAAVGAARPSILGGLWWQNNGYLSDMQVHNTNQVIPTAVTGFGGDAIIAVGSAGTMTVKNASLNSSGSLAQHVMGVYSGSNAQVLQSQINTQSSNDFTYGVYASNNSFISQSTINTQGTTFSFGVLNESGLANIANSAITVTGNNFVHGILNQNGSISLSNSAVAATGTGNIFGLQALGGSINMSNANIAATSNAGQAVGADADFGAGNIAFSGNQASHVSATSPASAVALNGVVSNNSTPKSKCSTNGGPSSDC